MQLISFQGINFNNIVIEGEIKGSGNYIIENKSSIFIIESKLENKVLEIRIQKEPYWVFSIGPYNGDFERNPEWKNKRYTKSHPILTEILDIYVPEDSVIEKLY